MYAQLRHGLASSKGPSEGYAEEEPSGQLMYLDAAQTRKEFWPARLIHRGFMFLSQMEEARPADQAKH